ncbi:MAG: gephyrin-like molybdotransferase Glp [Myxococcota bacterium]
MRGFAERADVEEVCRFLEAHSPPLEAEPVAVTECAGRVLAEEVTAEVDVPGFARAAMDGYAVRGEETFGASAYAPLALELIGTALPGAPFAGELGPRQAVRIMTGAPVPAGADAVLMAEHARERGSHVEVLEPVVPQKNVGRVGEDIRRGQRVLGPPRTLRPQDAAALASIGRCRILCVRRPRVRLVITGDELLPVGSRPEGPKIVDSNSVLLRALVCRDGGELLPFEILPDRAEEIRGALRLADADVVLVSGGSSVGQEDHAPRLVAELGTLDFHGVSMRPSSPAGCGRIGRQLVFLLPGNPVSCLCAYDFFAGPVIRALGARSRRWPYRRVRVPLGRKIASAVGRTDYVRVAIADGKALPIATSGASILSSTVRASGVVIVPRELEGMPEGASVEVLLYDAGEP